MRPFSNYRPWSLCITRGMPKRNMILSTSTNPPLCPRIYSYGEGLGPFAEIICNYQDVTVTIWSGVADVQNIHSYAIPTMTGQNISQGMMASRRRFSLDASNALCQPLLDIIRHAGPVEPMCQSSQCPVPAQMAAKQRGVISQEKLFPTGLRDEQL